ncbi:MAG TPA: sigma 54-interacting transcriptional regulator [Syntrophothermus lipocalidus]|uniref:PAS modulated sigma54 specific transcriptional regulator, Fis family n=1 Tax=Syntrophothermus lipocalidus (strain DSM 12680 / TGB-C1) TaxID=643648 RepID=D7CMP1_SYNLT|nr:sigma-54-dependent Fis family transcriptional regulator [Syntrophothermus lipocalidus]ADI01976.1 PAS modulated sigma54 specific transcriptional regulator, Fis family [Syntrophothermus lipocalidus DSM 12680]HHV76716.1 sigma 54-interacting transcriptional regulator [Syntrophothermus lipocalidus]
MPVLRISELQVGEAMTKRFGTASPDETLEQVIAAMLQNRWEEVVVVEGNGKLLGLVTKEHLVRILSDGLPQDKPIIDVCHRNVFTTTTTEDLVLARDVMREHHIGRLPVLDETGTVVGILTAKDVCNGFSDKLEVIGRHMQAVMDNITEAIQVVDCFGVITYWNKAAERMFGLKADDVVGKRLKEIYDDGLIESVLKEAKSRRNVLAELKPQQYAIRNAVPVITPAGDVIGVVCTTQDVTQTMSLLDRLHYANSKVKKLEKRVRQSEPSSEDVFYTADKFTLRVLQQARKVAATDATVLIQGESGTGKELLARVIYQNSKRSNRPFVEINCSAIPETLFESEMFGYESGSFTGAKREGKPGKFELAHDGTIFLDEIGELPLEMQAKLLRVIQEGRFYRVGGTNPIEVNVRLIAATNRNLHEMVSEGRFREDLFYRLNVVTLEIPPLRERKGDIPGLVARFINELATDYDREVDGIDDEALDVLVDYDWPGNVRQLRNVLESIIILMEGNLITLHSLEEAGVMDMLRPGNNGSRTKDKEVLMAGEVLEEAVAKTERDVIMRALEECGYNKARTAEMLGIPRSTLYYKLRTLGIPSISD